MKIAILGGGLSGLTLGYLLNEKGIDIEVLEKEENCGGLMRTIDENGFIFDYGGSHIIFSKDKRPLYFLLKLLKENVVINKRNTKVFFKNGYIKYPFENGLSDLEQTDNFECLHKFILNMLKKNKGDLDTPKNLFEWCYYMFGEAIAEKYLIPYNEKIWKFPTNQIALDWVERIPSPSLEDIIKSSLNIPTEGYKHQLYFYYPMHGGIASIIKSLKNGINGKIRKNFDVKSISKEGEKWKINNGKHTLEYDRIISTIPLDCLVNVLNAPIGIKHSAKRLNYNSLITVMIGTNKPKINEFSWIYIPDKGILAHRISFPSNYSKHVAPIDKSSILAEITCKFDDNIWREDDKHIIDKVINDLETMNILYKSEIDYINLKRIKYAYVIYDLEYKNNLDNVKRFLSGQKINIIGRFAEFKYMNMDDCILNAMEFVEKFDQS